MSSVPPTLLRGGRVIDAHLRIDDTAAFVKYTKTTPAE